MNAPVVSFSPRAKARALPADWSLQHDNRLRDAKGSYKLIRVLSDQWGIAETVLVARWHKLRAGSAASPGAASDLAKPLPKLSTRSNLNSPAATFAEASDVAGRFSGHAIGLVLADLAAHPGSRAAQIAARVGLTTHAVASLLQHGTKKLTPLGWSVRRDEFGRYTLERMAT